MAYKNYGMYSEAGNNEVAAIVQTARTLKYDWPTVYDELISLSERFPKMFGEATDTMVRDIVYDDLGFTTTFVATATTV